MAEQRSTRNDITGDAIRTRTISDAYRDNFDAIFGKKKEKDLNSEMKISPNDPEMLASS